MLLFFEPGRSMKLGTVFSGKFTLLNSPIELVTKIGHQLHYEGIWPNYGKSS